jgi:hypothetical protein
MMIEGSGSGSIPLTSGSGSGRPKNMWIRIRNTAPNFICLSVSTYLDVGPAQFVQNLGLARVHVAQHAHHGSTQHVCRTLACVLLLSLHNTETFSTISTLVDTSVSDPDPDSFRSVESGSRSRREKMT